MHKIVLLRHGESIWNKENLFTGWTDVDLSEKRIEEATEAGRSLAELAYTFDIAFTSVLKLSAPTLGLLSLGGACLLLPRVLGSEGIEATL